MGGGGDEKDGVGWDGIDVVALMRWSCAVILADVLYRVCRSDHLRRPILPFRRPHCEIGQETTMRMMQFEEGVGDIAAGEVVQGSDDGITRHDG